LFFLETTLFSQIIKDNFVINTYTTNNGLPSNLINDVNIDRNGYLWIATQAGLSRFDGINFVNFSTRNFNSIKSNRFILICKQKDGTLYLLNDKNQLFMVNSNSELIYLKEKQINKDFLRISGYKFCLLPSNSIKKQILKLYPNSKDNVFSNNDSSFYLIKNKQIIYQSSRQNSKQSINHDFNSAFFINDYFFVLDRQKNFTIFKNGSKSESFNLQKLVKEKINLNELYFSENNGQITMSMNSKYFKFDYINGKVSLIKENIDIEGNNEITLIKHPIKGVIMYYTKYNGLYIGKELSAFKNKTHSKDFSPIGHTYRLLSNKENDLIVFNDFKIELSSFEYVYFDITEDTFCLINSKNIRFFLKKTPLSIKNPISSISTNEVQFLDYYKNEGMFYIFGNDKVFSLKGLNEIKFEFEIKNQFIKSICKINNQDNWLINTKELGVLWYNGSKNSFKYFTKLKDKDVRTIQYDSNLDIYWVFTYGSGIYWIDNTMRVIEFKSDFKSHLNYAHYFLKDNKNYYWIPTNSGLFRYSLVDLKKVKNKSSDDVFYQYFSLQDGIINNEFNGRFANSGINLTNGNLAFSNIGGIVIVNPNKILSSSSSFPLLIDQILLNGEKLNLNSEIKTKEGFKSLVLKVSTPDYLSNSHGIIECKIPDLINEWAPVVNNTLEILSLKQGEYKIYFRKKGDQNKANYKTFVFIVTPPWYRSNFAFFIYFLLFVLSGYFISRYFFRIRQRKLKNELILMESELKALRAQINPHYLSNSLVSLQQLILKDNKLQALEVLSRYGKVMRSILNNSEHPFVSLYTEISTLKEYMELEALLLFENAEFNIHCKSIDNALLQSIQIPSMLIQPYVENAIIHGLIPKNRGPYQLSVSFEFNERLICTVQDNGVGRSPQIQNSQRISKGNKNVENRLKLYGKLLQQTMTVEIFDLKNELNEPIGTKVVIILPHSFNENKHQ
jgi:hypothetical protein